MTQDVSSTPAVVRRLDSSGAVVMAALPAIFEDLQTTLRCCERLVSELASSEAEPDDLTLEAFWTTAVLSYARCFAHREGGTNLIPDDVTATGLAGDVLGWHKVLLQLRDHYADPAVNPRETFLVGVSQDANGKANGVAITSSKRPTLDDLTVRQTGAVAFELTRIVDRRIAEHQDFVFGEVGTMTKSELDRLQLVEVAAET